MAHTQAMLGESEMKKRYSTNDEDFRYDSVEEVLQALADDDLLHAGQVYYEADCQPLTAQRLLNAAQVLERAYEIGHDMIGEEGWDDPFLVNEDAETELQLLLVAWAAKFVNLSRYSEIVGKTRKITVTEADLRANA